MESQEKSPRWKIRIHTHAGIVHVIGKKEPVVNQENGRVKTAEIDYITGDGGDTVGFMDWGQVSAITWKEDSAEKANAKEAKEVELDAAIAASGGPGCTLDSIAQKLGVSTRTARNRIEGYFGNCVSKKWKLVSGKVMSKTEEIDI